MSSLSTHILDISTGKLAPGVTVFLARDEHVLAQGITDGNGRIGAFPVPLTPGRYRLVAGAMSMATGEYVSVSSQSDTENAALAQEKKELETDYQGEVQELTSLYMQRGLEPAISRQVAEQLMKKDALDAHAREELGLTATNSARPLQAALFSAGSFSAGAALPLIVAWLAPAALVSFFIILSTLLSLAVLGYISSAVSKANPVRAIIRITFWSTMAMVLSMGIGHLAGQALF